MPMRKRQGVPIGQLYEEPVFSTCKPLWKMLHTVVIVPIGAYLLYCVLRGKQPDPFDGQILIAAACMVFYFVWRRGNHKSIMESGVYIVRWGYAVYIPWEKVKGAFISVDFGDSHILLDFQEDIIDKTTDTRVIFDEPKETGRFPINDDAIRCLMHHVPVTGDETWEKKIKKRVLDGGMWTA